MDIKVRLVIDIQQQFTKVLRPKHLSTLRALLVIFRLYHYVQAGAAVDMAASRHNKMVPVVQNSFVVSQANRAVMTREKLVRFAAFVQTLHPVLQVALIKPLPRRPIPGSLPIEFFGKKRHETA